MSIRVEGLAEGEAHRAIDAAFSEIATVHRLMSFHDSASEISRLNCNAARRQVEVHPWTYFVLEQAQQFSRASESCFDISVGAELVKWGMLPAPVEESVPQSGSWRDIELLPGSRVAFQRPLWIDLGGIAKGFAVDRATECLAEYGPSRSVVNAGGDIRVMGSDAEPIRLGAPSGDCSAPVLELADGSVAGSHSVLARRRHRDDLRGPHIDGSHRSPVLEDRFVCVIAEQCIAADALTKFVMAKGARTAEVLRKFSASAYVKDPGKDWQHIGAEEAEMQ